MNLTVNSSMMNNPFKVRRQTFGIFSFIFLLGFGVIFASVGALLIVNSKIDPSWIRMNGKVVAVSTSISNGSTTYTPVIQYSVDGQSYQVTSNSSSGIYPSIGQEREIAYNPNQPAQAKV